MSYPSSWHLVQASTHLEIDWEGTVVVLLGKGFNLATRRKFRIRPFEKDRLAYSTMAMFLTMRRVRHRYLQIEHVDSVIACCFLSETRLTSLDQLIDKGFENGGCATTYLGLVWRSANGSNATMRVGIASLTALGNPIDHEHGGKT
jgi:hypothetical protein